MDLEKQLAIHGAGKFELVDKSKTGKYKLIKVKAKDGDRYVIVDAQNNFVGTFRGGRYIPKGEPVGEFYYAAAGGRGNTSQKRQESLF